MIAWTRVGTSWRTGQSTKAMVDGKIIGTLAKGLDYSAQWRLYRADAPTLSIPQGLGHDLAEARRRAEKLLLS